MKFTVKISLFGGPFGSFKQISRLDRKTSCHQKPDLESVLSTNLKNTGLLKERKEKQHSKCLV